MYILFSDTAPTEIYTLSLHDALPISASARVIASIASGQTAGSWCELRRGGRSSAAHCARSTAANRRANCCGRRCDRRSEEHTSELQSQSNLVCRLLLEKKKTMVRAVM